jgi:Domain of unknown function (DUF4406)
MSSRPLVYIACPLTLGDREWNFHQACIAQKLLMRHGLAVINPALTMKVPGAWDIPHDVWMENALPQVARVDAVLRLPGESVGADLECAHARQHDIPVFVDEETLMEAFDCATQEQSEAAA